MKKAEGKTTTKYSVPVINLSTYDLKDTEYQQLKLDLDYSYIGKNKNKRKFLAANFEILAEKTSDYVEAHRLDEYRIQEKDVVVTKGDKDSSVVILNKTDYNEKLKNMVKKYIDKET